MKKQSNRMENGDVHLASQLSRLTGCLSDLPDIEFHWTKIEDCQCDSKKMRLSPFYWLFIEPFYSNFHETAEHYEIN
ncbi:hypothetical protein T09_7792 [Trichinella sp. T9]|nr:hypothetical protein T09_7792 [Trichinella sp. T9]